jgi:large-conductance mechanosensitive channel
MGVLIWLFLWAFCLFILYLVIRTAIDHSRTTLYLADIRSYLRDVEFSKNTKLLKEIRDLLQEQNKKDQTASHGEKGNKIDINI